MRILIAGVGNVLRGDDGFGVAVLQSLQREIGNSSDVTFYESGIAGIGLVQQLFDGFDALIIIDSLEAGAAPGTLIVHEPDLPALAAPGRTRERVDLHQAGPKTVLQLAAALDILPPRVWIVGCQATDCDDLGACLSEPVRGAIPAALRQVHELLAKVRTGAGQPNGSN